MCNQKHTCHASIVNGRIGPEIGYYGLPEISVELNNARDWNIPTDVLSYIEQCS